MKKFILIIICLGVLVSILIGLFASGSNIQEEWGTIIVGGNVPVPQEGTLNSGSNLDDYFSGSIKNVSEEYYNEYVNACIDMGYTVDSEKIGLSYDAFDADGNKISLSYISGDMHIIIQVPEVLSEFVWPTTGIATEIPVPTSNLCKVTSDTSKSFGVIVGNTPIESYNEYVKSCMEKGFDIDYIKNEESYSAKNSEGFRLNVSYVGCNRIEILIQTPKENDVIQDAEVTSIEEETYTDVLREEFKTAMDSYEEFMCEYVDFMKEYQENPDDMSLLVAYADYMKDYTEFVEDFEKWEDEEMNAAETAYYIDVQTRVNKKLLEIAE